MGQAFRRAMGRVPSPARTRPSPHPPPQNISRNPDQVSPPSHDGAVASRDRLDFPSSVESNILEERDPEYDAMLQKMSGTIRSKSGGKLEMGEAFIVQKYKRPLPKVRSSVEESGSDGKKSLIPGTLTVSQLQEIILLHVGKSAEHKGSMDVKDIANKFGVDAAQVEQIIHFISLPPEHEKKDINKSN